MQVVTALKELWPGCTMVAWQYNTNFHSAIQQVPYVAKFGQVPRIGMQSLRLRDDLANSLTAEADLNAALGLPGQRMQQPRPLMAQQVSQVNLRRMGGWHRGSTALALATRKI
eukprot:jgi/Tetstr1/421342/TSEL_012312.t1